MAARVVLRKARTYQLGGRRWIKDVPGIVKGEELIKQYQENAYFHVSVLGGSDSKKSKAKDESKADDDGVEEKSESKAKTAGKTKLKK